MSPDPQHDHDHGPDDQHADDRRSKTDDPTVAPETLGIDDTDTALAPEDASAPVE
jgi:hypothetical protein